MVIKLRWYELMPARGRTSGKSKEAATFAVRITMTLLSSEKNARRLAAWFRGCQAQPATDKSKIGAERRIRR